MVGLVMMEHLGEVPAIERLAALGADLKMLGVSGRFRPVYAAADAAAEVIDYHGRSVAPCARARREPR